MKKAFFLSILIVLIITSGALAGGLADCTGVIRVFGDQSNWMSTCFVVGDGSWVVTTIDAVSEKVGPKATRLIRYPVFISPYSGAAYQCELKAQDKDLNIALLKLPVTGLPAAQLAQGSDFSKAAMGTMGELMSGDPIGNRWPTEIYGVTREKSGDSYKLAVGEWGAKQVFITEMGKYHRVFLMGVSPAQSVPNGSMVARGPLVVGMYLNRMVITGGKEDQIFGTCSIATAIARWLGDHGVPSASLYSPPASTIKREDGADTIFQLQARIYSMIGAARPDLALESAQSLVKLRPSEAQPHLMLGLALTGVGKFDEAIAQFDEVAKIDPKLPTLHTSRALALIGQKKPDEAEKELLQAVAEAPGDVRPVAALADFYLADGKTFDKAYAYAQKATSMAPDSPAAYLLLARVEKRQKKYQDAVNSIGEALKMAKDWPEAWYALGSTYEEAGDKEKAEKAYRAFSEKQPKNPASLLTLASFLVDQGKTDDAAEIIAKIRALNPPKEISDAVKALEEKTAVK
ncbi:MAG: tetratricopeptide repeat protein [Armatimonadota bacterium]